MAQEDPVLDVCSAYELALFVLSDLLPSVVIRAAAQKSIFRHICNELCAPPVGSFTGVPGWG